MLLYVLVVRCIVYPFNAKQPTDMVRRQVKITKSQLQSIREKFQVFVEYETITIDDECNIYALSKIKLSLNLTLSTQLLNNSLTT